LRADRFALLCDLMAAAGTDIGVPFLDLGITHAPLREAILEDVSELIATGAFTNGPQVAAFEKEFARYCGTSDCVGLASGLDALRLALLAVGIGPGDEVIVPANTFVATFEAIAQAGATPFPVNVSSDDYNIDPVAAEAAVTPRTRAIMPVHLYGQLADMAAIHESARRHDLVVVEDAAQAHGASRAGFTPGSHGSCAAFSFYPGKNLGAFGDGGALVGSNERMMETVRMLREHGQREKYRHELVGYTARLDTIQAIVLLHKLPHLDGWNDWRREVADRYSQALTGLGDLVLPRVAEGSRPAWHLYVVTSKRRDALLAHLRQDGVGAGMHYPQPAHLSPAFAHLGHGVGAFPVTEAMADRLLSLPIFPGMSETQVDRVVDSMAGFFSHGG
jgi:dTDP-4-amino-4,6-dideoxygalactose transaminase